MNKILLLSVLLLISCTEKKQSTTSPKENIESEQKETIKSIEINNAGGQLGYVSTFRMTGDSIIFNSDMTAAPNKKTALRKPLKKGEAEKIFEDLDLKDFNRAVEGQSKQPFDGIDNVITIQTQKKEHSKRNAPDNKTWMKILELKSKYVDQP